MTKAINYKKQQGFTLMGRLFVISIALFFLYTAKVAYPLVSSNIKMNQTLKDIKKEYGMTQKNKKQIKQAIKNKIIENNIDISLEDKNITISRAKDWVGVSLKYTQSSHYYKNAFLEFEHEKKVEFIRN